MDTGSVSNEISVRDGRNLITRPWGHQRDAIDFLQRHLHKPRSNNGYYKVDDGGGALLAMGMGTGKSLVGVSMCCNLPVETVLIICPNRVVDVWPEQFARHAGRTDLRIVTLGEERGSVARKATEAQKQLEIARTAGERFIAIINYESAWREPFRSWVLNRVWGLGILDESHRIKHASGKTSTFAAKLREHTTWRLGLTGTPLPHTPLDIFAQARYLAPEIYGTSYHAFRQCYAVYGGFNQKQIVAFQNLTDLQERMRLFTFRVGKEVLDLPEQHIITRHCTLSRAGAQIYGALDREFIAEVESGVVTADNALVKLLRLQQVTGGTVKTTEGAYVRVDWSKQELLEEIFEDLDATEPVVVFCRFHSDLDIVHHAAATAGRQSLELSGRRDQLKQWQAGGAPILAVQIQAGGVGIDLTRACYSIYYSLSFSLAEYDQSLSRVHRPGQTRTVTQIHLVAQATVDRKIMRALEKRQEVVNSILNEIKGGRQQQQ